MRAVEPIPDAMQAAVLHAYDGAPDSLRVETRPVPRPQRGQVLVKMTAAPINPSDTIARLNLYNRSVNDFAAQNTEGLIS